MVIIVQMDKPVCISYSTNSKVISTATLGKAVLYSLTASSNIHRLAGEPKSHCPVCPCVKMALTDTLGKGMKPTILLPVMGK